MKTATWMLAAALGTAGCGGSMMSDPDEMRSMIDDARQENVTHVTTTDAADSLAQVRDEMNRHEGAMGDMMDMMDSEMDGMSHCNGSGMQDLRDMHDGMLGEMDQHGTAMDQAVDLDAATAEGLATPARCTTCSTAWTRPPAGWAACDERSSWVVMPRFVAIAAPE